MDVIRPAPMLFGLPSNADSFVQTRVAAHVQDTLRQLGTDSQAASAFDRDACTSPLYLPYISPISPLYLYYIRAAA